MAIMAGMLPGVERARRRRLRLRLRQGRSSSSSGAAAQALCGTRRAPSSSCLYGARGGHDPARLLGGPSSSAPKQGRRSGAGACVETLLDGSAREAKERLDQKLRGRRESCVAVKNNKRHQSTGAARPPTTAEPHGAHPAAAAGATPTTPCPCALRREVFSEPEEEEEGRRRWLSCCWTWRPARRGQRPQAEACDEECAVCLEDLRAGDVVARLPCAHRFHWSCAAPWVQAASRCPVCRARARLDLAAAGDASSPN